MELNMSAKMRTVCKLSLSVAILCILSSATAMMYGQTASTASTSTPSPRHPRSPGCPRIGLTTTWSFPTPARLLTPRKTAQSISGSRSPVIRATNSATEAE